MKHFFIKNSTKEMLLLKRRIIVISIAITILTLILAGRLFALQIIQHKYYTTLSKLNSIDLNPIEPRRGIIYDRNGIILAKNIPTFSLMVTPSKTQNLNQTITELNKIIPLSKNDLEQFHKQFKQHRRFEQILLKLKLTEEEAAKFAVNSFRFPGFSVQTKLIRQYPLGETFAHVIGYVGRINTRDLNTIDTANYAATNFIGKVGIEKYYEPQLHGLVGYQKIETDANGKTIRTINTTPPTPGNNLYLTIDSRLQQVAAKALTKHNGAVVAIQPSTGEILAIASNPSYDPNTFINGISYHDFQQLQHDKNHPLYNRPLRGLYPPGSTIKPFIAIEGLKTNTITAAQKIFDPGWYQIPNTTHIFHDWRRTGHGWVNLSKAIIESCDTYFWKLANALGIRQIDEILNQFNFGTQTGIDMQEELPGNVPSPEWKLKYNGQAWFKGDTANAGIGQGYIEVTPLQLATATAILANRGMHLKPHLLYATQSPDGTITKTQPTEEPPVILNNPKNWETVINAMSKVITGATGYRFGHKPPYTVAAKTGTAQLVSLQYAEFNNISEIPKNLRDNSVFITFAPTNHPKIALAIVSENSTDAPRIAREILDYYLLALHGKPNAVIK
ncbi:MAG: penicillin-binding protein 2 [Gammaproteobacteria bacterium]|jgi:penicillin-binding protein 2